MSDKYERWKEVYRSGQKGLYPWELGRPRDFLVELVEKGMIRGHQALDTCCGLGTNGLYLAEKGFDVTGIDISDKAVEIANQKAQKKAKAASARFQVENFMKMKFKEMSFDFVLDVGCFHHVAQEDRHAFIENVHRVLRPGGRYLLMCFSDRMGRAWNHFSERQIRELFSGHFKTLLLDEISSMEGDGATRNFYVALMEKMLPHDPKQKNSYEKRKG
jgi:ubiquinone/menaquinone biosynthesis C-methylase UbiE